MKKSTVLILALSFMIILAVSSFSPASAAIAPGTYTDHTDAGGTTALDIPGHVNIIFDGYNIASGDLGTGDVIRILLRVVLPSGATVLVPLAIFTDMPDRISLFQMMYAGYPTYIQLVNDPSAIEAVREGKSKNIHVVWKVPLVVPTEDWPLGTIPGVTIPPGRLIFRGHGDVISGSVPPTIRPTWSQTATWSGYYGDATFVCPTWHFGGPVGVNEGNDRTLIRTDASITTIVS